MSEAAAEETTEETTKSAIGGGGEEKATDDKSTEEKADDETGADDKSSDDGDGDKGSASDDSKDEDGKEGDEGEDGDEGGAPESYDDFDLPEGFEASDELTSEFTELFRESNLSQEHAQKLISTAIEKLVNPTIERVIESQAQQFQGVCDEWAGEMKSDPELGGEGYDEMLAKCAKTIDTVFGVYGDSGKEYASEFRQILDATGAGNHRAIGRFITQVGKLVLDDSLEAGGGSGSGGDISEKDVAHQLYPDLA